MVNKKYALRPKRIMEQLEDRILFDAVPDATFLVPEAAEQPLFVQEQMATETQQVEQSSRELILVDAGVENSDLLIREILDAHPNESFEVRILSADQDGISQISDILNGTSDSYSACLLYTSDAADE